MPDGPDPLAELAALEGRYDGPVPEPALLIARFGSAALAQALYAEGQMAFFRHMMKGQLRIIRRRRREGSLYPGIAEDLRLYRRRWAHWRRVACTYRASISNARALTE